MPHAEYPSGSACLCTAYAKANQIRYGTDVLQFPLSREYSPFSSKVEPLSTPKNNITFLYYTWSDIAKRCSETRAEGGMHFTEAVPAGASLCEPIGEYIGTVLVNLKNGIAPDYVIDINDKDIRERTCYPNENACTLPKKCENEPCLEHELGGNCKKYQDGKGCTKCKTGFYIYDYNYPCIDCKMSCKNCKKCENFNGCKNCKGKKKFDIMVDDSTNLQYCQPK